MAKEFNYKDYLKNNPLLTEDQGYDDELDDSLGAKHGGKKQDMKQRRVDSENMEKAKGKRKYSGDKSIDESTPPSKISVTEFKAQIREKILAEMENDLDESSAVNWRDRNSPAGDSLELAPKKAGTSTVQEEEDVDIEDDVDIDIERDIDIDDEETESDIEIKTSVPGEDTEVEAVQGLLTKAQQEAEKLGDDKLMAQIGNTITYFTRKHVVKV